MEVQDFKKKIVLILRDISYMARQMEKKSSHHLKHLDTSTIIDKDIKSAGLAVVTLLQQFTENVFPILNSFEEDIGQLNEEKQLFYQELSSKLSQCKACISSKSVNNNVPSQNDVETTNLNLIVNHTVDEHNDNLASGNRNGDLDGSLLPSTLNNKVLSQNDRETNLNSNEHEHSADEHNVNISSENTNENLNRSSLLPSTSTDSSFRRKHNLSLKKLPRSETPDTNDEWDDTLKRGLNNGNDFFFSLQ